MASCSQARSLSPTQAAITAKYLIIFKPLMESFSTGRRAGLCRAGPLSLEQLEIVAKIPAGLTYGDLLLNPCWDNLRGDKRFDKIVAAAKAASR